MDAVSVASCIGTAASLRSVAARFRTEAERQPPIYHVIAEPHDRAAFPDWPEVPIYDAAGAADGVSLGLADTDWRELHGWPHYLGIGVNHYLLHVGRLWCGRYLWRPQVLDFTPEAVRRDDYRNGTAIARFETLAHDALGLFDVPEVAMPPEAFKAEHCPREPRAAHRWLEIVYGTGGSTQSAEGTFRLARLRGSIWLASAEALEGLAEKLARPAETNGQTEQRGTADEDSSIDATEANNRARDALKARPPKGKRRWTTRDLGKAIGYSASKVVNLPAWRAYAENHGISRSTHNLAGRAVNLTDGVLANAGGRDDQLERVQGGLPNDAEIEAAITSVKEHDPDKGNELARLIREQQAEAHSERRSRRSRV